MLTTAFVFFLLGITYSISLPHENQINLQEVVQRVTNDGSSQEVFQSLVDGAVNLLGDGSAVENLVNELRGEEGLAQVPVLPIVIIMSYLVITPEIGSLSLYLVICRSSWKCSSVMYHEDFLMTWDRRSCLFI